MFIFLQKTLQQTSSLKPGLRVLYLNLKSSYSTSYSSSSSRIRLDGGKSLFIDRYGASSGTNKLGGRFLFGPKKDSFVSSHLSLFIRRQRYMVRSKGGANAQQTERLKGKIDKAGVRRLISLAKPERAKIAGKGINIIVKIM